MKTVLKKIVGFIGGALGVLVTLLTVFTFFSVKPLPLVEIDLTQAENDDQTAVEIAETLGSCVLSNTVMSDEYKHLERPEGLKRLAQNHGQLIYVKLKISSEISLTGVDRPNAYGCVLGLNNLAENGAGLWGDIEILENFEIQTKENVPDPLDPSYEGTVGLLLPRKSQPFTTVMLCESHCYQLEGAVRVQQAFSSEGYIGLRLVPVDVYANSYLTSRYECRLKVQDSPFELFAPIICALL